MLAQLHLFRREKKIIITVQRLQPAQALIKLPKCLISTINVHNEIWGFKLSWRNCNSLCGLPLPYGGEKLLCRTQAFLL